MRDNTINLHAASFAYRRTVSHNASPAAGRLPNPLYKPNQWYTPALSRSTQPLPVTRDEIPLPENLLHHYPLTTSPHTYQMNIEVTTMVVLQAAIVHNGGAGP
ncbi:MAG: hypothetical protein ACYTBZ_16215 [Planctomycetota bacterium]|jgi:hypothetical protein